MRDTRHRRYILTINNPGEDWQEEIRVALSQMVLIYWCFSMEKGLEEQTPHLHIYFAAKTSAIRFSTVKTLFPTAHIEPAQGTSEECRAYVQKSGDKWANDEKADTSIPGTFEEWGELPTEYPGQRTDLAMAYEMLQEGASITDIIRNNPDMMRFRNHLEQTRQDLIAEEYRTTFRQLEVTYISGATAFGKTRYVMEKHGYENVCQITGYQHGCFDKYGGEDVLILDEYCSSFRIQDINNYLDGYPLYLPCRYANRVACYTKVYIISNIPLEFQYSHVRVENPATWSAFIRRINKVMVFYDVGEYETYRTQEYRALTTATTVPTTLATTPTLETWQEVTDDNGDLPF